MSLMHGPLETCLVLTVLCLSTEAFSPRVFLGRPRHGLVKPPELVGMTDHQFRQLMDNPPTVRWFRQRVDHFTPTDIRSWKQKYFQAGPVQADTLFVLVGGEAAISAGWMVSGQWTEYAERHRAARVQLEHRFYGDSHPTRDLSVENLRYLTTDQALADLASFIASKKQELGASRVIVVGGSYAGVLAAWFRLKYPHLVEGAVASSAPVLAQVDFQGYLEILAQSLNTFKPATACNDAISAANADIKEKLRTREGRMQITKTFNLCDPVDVSSMADVANLFSILAGNFKEVVQYNNMTSGPDIQEVCSIMTDKSLGSEMDRYAQVNSLVSGEECLHVNYSHMIDHLKHETWDVWTDSGHRQWSYQTCTQLGFFQSSDSTIQPFGHEFPVGYFLKLCSDIFGAKLSRKLIYGAVNATNVSSGGAQYAEDRVVFVNGNIDPWHYLGITKNLPQAPVFYVKGSAHCADMYTERPGDPPGLVKVRQLIDQIITQWLRH